MKTHDTHETERKVVESLLRRTIHEKDLGAAAVLLEHCRATQSGLSAAGNWVVALGLKPAQDGNQWSFVWGENLRAGVVGFGDTPLEAMAAFNTAMTEKVTLTEKAMP